MQVTSITDYYLQFISLITMVIKPTLYKELNEQIITYKLCQNFKTLVSINKLAANMVPYTEKKLERKNVGLENRMDKSRWMRNVQKSRGQKFKTPPFCRGPDRR